MKFKITISSAFLTAFLLSLPTPLMGDIPLVSELFTAAPGSDISALDWSNIGSGQIVVSDVVVAKGSSACNTGNSAALYEKNLANSKSIGKDEVVSLSAVVRVKAPEGCSNRAGVGIKTAAGEYSMDVYRSAGNTNKGIWAVWLPGSTSAIEFDLPQGDVMDMKVVLTSDRANFYGRPHGTVYWKLIHQSANGASSVTGVRIKMDANNPSGSAYPRLDSVYMGHSDDFGKNWVRNHPFQINGYTQRGTAEITQSPKQFAKYTVACGMNSLVIELRDFNTAAVRDINMFALRGMVWHALLHASGLMPAMKQTVNGHSKAEDDNGWLIADEPGVNAVAGVGQVRDWIKLHRPKSLAYACAHPDTVSDEAWIEGFLTQIRPDVLQFNNYPYFDDTHWYEHLADGIQMYRYLAAYREKAQERRIPLWAFLQAWYAPSKESHRESSFPSGSDLRKQAFVYLASGVKSLCYFIWDSTTDYMYGLINVDGSLARSRDGATLFQHAAKVNREILTLGNYLKYLESTDIRFFAGIPLPPGAEKQYVTRTGDRGHYPNATPPGLIDWTPGAGGENRILSFGVQSPTKRTNGFVGYFEDDTGQKYFMLTNLLSGRKRTPEQTQTTFNIVFDKSVKGVYRLNRITGRQQWLAAKAGVVTVVLPGGTGDLFTISSAGFDLAGPKGGISIASRAQ